jgi:cell wall assembly regulator SMI1
MLEELEVRWRAQGAAIAGDLRPGLEAAAIQEATAAVGVQLPVEARVWWGWHDGTSRSLTSHAIGGDLLYLTIEAAVTRYQRERAGAAAAMQDGVDPQKTWPPTWFPMAARGDGAVMACDCAVDEGAPTPIRRVHWEKYGNHSLVPVAPSLGTVVSWWIDAIDAGAWRFDKERGLWDTDSARLPDPALERTGLV